MHGYKFEWRSVCCEVRAWSVPEGISWHAHIARTGFIDREFSGCIPGLSLGDAGLEGRIEEEMREAIAWLEGRFSNKPEF